MAEVHIPKYTDDGEVYLYRVPLLNSTVNAFLKYDTDLIKFESIACEGILIDRI